MRVLFLPACWTILLCFFIWPILQVSATLICQKLPDKIFSNESFIFRAHRFEIDGHFYNNIFGVSKWKRLLPDGGKVFKRHGYSKKHLDSFSEESLTRFLIESARGELTHWMAIFPFWIFGFFTPPQVIILMLAYSLLVNLPCIIAQRYNRPRVQRLLNKMKR